jgi:diphthamide biosynthesis protein 2
LYGLEYAYALDDIRQAIQEACKSCPSNLEVQYADVLCSVMSPSSSSSVGDEFPQLSGTSCSGGLSIDSDAATFLNNHSTMEQSSSTRKYSLGGVTWDISAEDNMEDYFLFWIGQDNSAFMNIVLTFNKCEIGLFSYILWVMREFILSMQVVLFLGIFACNGIYINFPHHQFFSMVIQKLQTFSCLVL